MTLHVLLPFFFSLFLFIAPVTLHFYTDTNYEIFDNAAVFHLRMHIISLAMHINKFVDKPLSARKISCLPCRTVENCFLFHKRFRSSSICMTVVRNFAKFQICFR